MVPMDSSPARNAGSPVSTPFPVGDQRRLPFIRIFDGRIDMGAVEIQPPPPTPDFNGDGVADCNDVDALTAEIVAGNHNPQFDLTRDGLVTRVDLLKWLDDAPDVNGLPITRYLVGDANLDTVVDISDFNIWNANKFTPNTAWCSGNFNADAVIDISDFNIWNANKFTASPSITSCGLFNDGSGSSAFAPPVSDLMDYGTSELEVAAAPSPMRNLTGDVNVSSRSTHSTDTQRDESTLIEDTIAAVFAGWDSII